MTTYEPRVFIDSFQMDDLDEKLKLGFEFIQLAKFNLNDKIVFIKPNLTAVNHQPGITVTPFFLEKLVEILAPKVKKLIIGESDGGNYSFSADTSLKNHHIPEIASRYDNVEIVNLSKLPVKKYSGKIWNKTISMELPVLLAEGIDLLISCAVLKTHAMTHGTFGLKNLWGCYPNPMRLLYHQNLDYKLSFMSKLFKHRITVIDGTFALDGHGPMEGSPKKVNKILIGNDVVATDASGAYIMQLNINKITHLLVANKAGLGTIKIKDILYNSNLKCNKLQKFLPYKIKMDYLSWFLFRSVIISKLIFRTFLTPYIYKLINLTRPKNKRTYWADYNRNMMRAPT